MVNTLIITEPNYLDLKDALSQYPSAEIVCESDAVTKFICSVFSKNAIHYRELISRQIVKTAATNLDLAIITVLSIQEKSPLLMARASVVHKYIIDFYNDCCLEWPPKSIDIDIKFPKWLCIVLESHINYMIKSSLMPPQFAQQSEHVNLAKSDVDVIWLVSSIYNVRRNIIDEFISSAKRVIKKSGVNINHSCDITLKTFNTELEELNYIRNITSKNVVIVSNDEKFNAIYSASIRARSKRFKIMNLISDHILRVGNKRLNPTLYSVSKDVNLLSEMHSSKTDFINMIKSHIDICNIVSGDSIMISKELYTSLNKAHVNDYRSAIAFISTILEEHDSPIKTLSDAMNLPAKSFVIQGANQEAWRMHKDIEIDLNLLIKRADVAFTRSINGRDSLHEEAEFLNRFKINKVVMGLHYTNRVKMVRPNPMPPIKDRPLAISPTAVEMLIRNPYSYYAKYILRLYEKRGEVEFFKEFGKIMHSIVDNLQRIEDFGSFDAIYQSECVKMVYESPLEERDKVVVLQRLENLKPQIFQFLKNWSQNCLKTEIESVEYKDFMLIDGTVVKLKAIPDRVDYIKDGTVRITDYKTGSIPSQQEVNSGYYPQLPLEGLIYGDMSSLFYVGISGMVDKFDVKKILCNYEDVLISMRGLMEMFLSSQSQGYFASTSEDSKTNGYNHLSRLEEWKYNNENINRSSDTDNT